MWFRVHRHKTLMVVTYTFMLFLYIYAILNREWTGHLLSLVTMELIRHSSCTQAWCLSHMHDTSRKQKLECVGKDVCQAHQALMKQQSDYTFNYSVFWLPTSLPHSSPLSATTYIPGVDFLMSGAPCKSVRESILSNLVGLPLWGAQWKRCTRLPLLPRSITIP